MSVTFTRTHVFTKFANPYLACDTCREPVTSFHDSYLCGCDATWWNEPCGCLRSGVTSACPSWSLVDGCLCRELHGLVEHAPAAVRDTDTTEAGQP